MGTVPEATGKAGELDEHYRSTTRCWATGPVPFTVQRHRAVEPSDVLVLTQQDRGAVVAGSSEELLPENAVEYFVSYYDYYCASRRLTCRRRRTPIYREKDLQINAEIEKMRSPRSPPRCRDAATSSPCRASRVSTVRATRGFPRHGQSTSGSAGRATRQAFHKLVEALWPPAPGTRSGAGDVPRQRRYGGIIMVIFSRRKFGNQCFR